MPQQQSQPQPPTTADEPRLPFLSKDVADMLERITDNPDLSPDELGWLVYLSKHYEIVEPPAAGEPAGTGSEVEVRINGSEPFTYVLGSYFQLDRPDNWAPSSAPIRIHLDGARPGDVRKGTIGGRKVTVEILRVSPVSDDAGKTAREEV
jgi:hypothetical protein